MDVRREQLIAAYQKWRAAERAYSDEVSQDLVPWFGEQGPAHDPAPVNREALKRLRELRDDADIAQREYEEHVAAQQ